MARANARAKDPQTKNPKTDLEIFAKAYFGIELTSKQIEIIKAIASGRQIRLSRRSAISAAQNIIRAYIREGLDPYGRQRIPQHTLPVREKLKGVTQEGRVLELIKRPGGAYNFQLARIALKYTSVISALRKDGHNILAERQYLKNGRPSNTWKYYLIGN